MGLIVKILLLVGLIMAAAALLFGRRRSGSDTNQTTTRSRGSARSEGAGTPPQDMVVCLHCGVHLPASESVTEANQHFCCVAHRDAHRR